MTARAILAVLGLAFAVCDAAAQVNANVACTCENLESLQQEVENAEYLIEFMRDLSGRLDRIEQEQVLVNQDPTHPDSGRSVLTVSANARDQMMKPPSQGGIFNLPHPQVKGYTGPQKVDLKPNTCENEPGVLKALELGSPCRDIAEITLRHEEVHRAECKAVGWQAYWARLPSSMAAEESERYTQQAREMREALKRVIDEGEVTLESVTNMQGRGQGFSGSWIIKTDKAVLEGKSAPGAKTWTLKGRTTGTSRMTSANVGGKACSTSGEFHDEVLYDLETDGFKVTATETTRSVSGQMSVKCGQGIGMSMRPSNEVGSGEIFRDLPFKAQTDLEQEVATMQFAQAIAGAGMTVSGTHKATLICKPR